MPIDEVLLRDSCGKSSTKLKKYFYYNEYSKDNFPFKSDYNELILLDIIDGKMSFIDIIFMLFPYILIFILAIICIGIWISICCCSCRPKCLLKKNNKNPKKVRFTCFMVFLGFSISLVILGIIIMVYINMAEKNFNGSICSLLMFQYEIVNGQGLLARKHINKPYWYGSTQIAENIEKINELITTLKTNCRGIKNNLNDVFNNNIEAIVNLNISLDLIYSANKDQKLEVLDVDDTDNSKFIYIIPLYILNLGPKENSSTLTGQIYEDYMKNYNYMFYEIIAPTNLLCQNIGEPPADDGDRRILQPEDEAPLSDGLGDFSSVIGGLNDALESITSKITEYIANYKNYIINFLYKVSFYLFGVTIGSIIIEIIFYIIYYFHPFSLIKCNIYFFIHLISFLLILCIIYNAIFGIFSLLMGNLADIIDAVLSRENLSSESPKLIGEGENIKKLEKCIRGDGNLFQDFLDDDMKQIINYFNLLYTIYTPVRTIHEKTDENNLLMQNEKNEYNTFMKLEEIINNLKNMIDDFIPTTTKESAGNYDIQTLFDSLTDYTNYGKSSTKQESCTNKAYDTWTTVSHHCPFNGNPGIINDRCKLLSDHYLNPENYDSKCGSSDPSTYTNVIDECEAAKISRMYNTDSQCSEIDYNKKIYSYSKTLLKYYRENILRIFALLGANQDNNACPEESDDFDPANDFCKLKYNFNGKFITPIKGVIDEIDEKITTPIYELFNKFLDDKTKDTYQLKDSKDFDLFSWMNCSAIGQDYNATLSTFKSSLTKELKIITIVSLLFEFISIANLYIMVGLSKNLIDKKYEKNEEKNVSIEELDINEIKETKSRDEIYSIKSKNKIDSSEKLEKKINTDNNGMEIEQNENENNPTAQSINGSDRKSLAENGERMNEILNIKQKK